MNAIARDLDNHPTVARAGGIAYERDTLLAGDPRFTTHSVIHRFTRGFLFGRPGLDKDTRGEVDNAQVNRLSQYLLALGEQMPWFQSKETNRDEYLARSSVVLSALSVVGHDLFASGLDVGQIALRIIRLGRMDWRKTNLGWVGILGSEKDGKVQPASSRPAIDGLIRHLRKELGLVPQ